MVIETPLPTTAGKFSDDAATVCPPAPVVTPEGGFKKSNVYWKFGKFRTLSTRKTIDAYLSIIQRPDTINLGRGFTKLSNEFSGGDSASGTSKSQNKGGSGGEHN